MIPCPPELRTARLLLRRWRASDRPAFAALAGNPHVMRYFASTRTREQSDAEADFLRGRFAVDGFGPWAVEIPGTAAFIGFVGCWRVTRPLPFVPAIEIGWRLDAPFWGHSFAREAACAALEDVFGRTATSEVVAYTAALNAPSRRVMEKLGMTRDPQEDFEHPAVPENDALRPHVLYRISRARFAEMLPR